MPELPDIQVYLECLDRRITGQPLVKVRLKHPFFLRNAEPPLSQVEGKKVIGFDRFGKRIVFRLEKSFFLVLHLMIAGRLHWKAVGATPPGKIGLAAFDFPLGTLTLTEAGNKRRASLYVIQGESRLAEHQRGGLEVLQAELADFRMALYRENHTLKRALTSPHLFSGIGNAYSDEILHRARLSPLTWTRRLSEGESACLFTATQVILREWIDKLRQ